MCAVLSRPRARINECRKQSQNPFNEDAAITIPRLAGARIRKASHHRRGSSAAQGTACRELFLRHIRFDDSAAPIGGCLLQLPPRCMVLSKQAEPVGSCAPVGARVGGEGEGKKAEPGSRDF